MSSILDNATRTPFGVLYKHLTVTNSSRIKYALLQEEIYLVIDMQYVFTQHIVINFYACITFF
jgi:hypothetical protein